MNDKIPSKFLDKSSITSHIDLIVIEFYQNIRKWLSLCVYKPPNQKDSVFVEAICEIINEYLAQYKHIVFGDFIMSIENYHFQNLMRFISPYKRTDMFPNS